MEDENATITNNKHRKKKIVLPLTTLPIGGEGGIAGLLVFGGALAIGGVMAAMSLSNNKRKAKAKGTIIHHQPKPQQLFLDNDDGHNIEDNHQTTQTHIQLANVSCCWTSNQSINQVSSSELLSVPPLTLEKIELKPNRAEESPTSVHHQEIVFSDYSRPESATSSNENGAAEECLESLLEKDEPQEGLTSAETESETEEEEEEDDDSDDVTEISEEETGSTSMDYNQEPIWPAKLLREPFERDNHSDVDCSDYGMRVGKGTILKEKANFCMELNDHRRPSVIMTTWVIPMLLIALLLLLVLLNRHPQPAEAGADMRGPWGPWERPGL